MNVKISATTMPTMRERNMAGLCSTRSITYDRSTKLEDVREKNDICNPE